MAGPNFVLLNDEKSNELFSDCDAHNTKRGIKSAKSRLESFAKCVSMSLAEVTSLPDPELDKSLSRFYAGLRKDDGSSYAKKSMHFIRYGLHCHFEYTRGEDITSVPKFPESQRVYKAMMVKLKKERKGFVKHKIAVTDSDMAKIFESDAVNSDTSLRFQNKVLLDVMTYFGQRGYENPHDMTVNDYIFPTDEDGLRHFEHRDNKIETGNEDEEFGGRMYEIPGSSRCHVTSLLKHLACLNPKSTHFWQRPKASSQSDGPWFDNVLLGVNTLGYKMREIAERAQCDRHYTNHSLRATTVTILDQAGFENRDIMAVTGHKSESSLKNHARISDKKNKMMSAKIFKSIQGLPSTSGSNDGLGLRPLNGMTF